MRHLTTNPYEGCWHRIDRAEAHRESAAAMWNDFLDRDPYDAHLSVSDEGVGTLWIEQLEPTPPQLSVLVGEWLYNLRAALDYCVYSTAIRDTGQDPPPREGVLQFPIYAEEAAYRANERRIEPLSEQHRAWLEEVQPFKAANPKGTLLYWVNELSRRDRHRQLHVVGAYVSESRPAIYSTGSGAIIFDDDINPFTFVEGDAVIAEFRLEPYLLGDHVEANPDTALDVEILEMANERPHDAEWMFEPLTMRLRLIEYFIDAIVGRFELDTVGYTRSRYLRRDSSSDAEENAGPDS